MRNFYLIFILIISFQIAQAQIDFTPYSGNSTHCPGEYNTYSASGTNCGPFTWTITNGKIRHPQSHNEVITLTGYSEAEIKWDDIAGTGKLKVSATCSGETKFEEKSFAIRSLKGRTPENPIAFPQQLPYCSTSPVQIQVDEVLLLNTGGATGIPQQYADGYEWVLPTGWKHNGVAGTVSSTTRYITITPDNGCAGGSVSVKAYSNCSSGRKYSSPATINVNRQQPSISITPQAGYSGPSCGNKEPVTFTVTPMSCATNYLWVFPSGWLQSPVYTTSNSITVTPSGGELDGGGTIQVTVNLNCGLQLPSSPYPLTFNKPAITVQSAICFGGSNVTVANVASNVNVNWSVSNNMNILSGQGTPNAVIGAKTQFIRETGTINATVSCPNTTVPQKVAWVGKPYDLLVTGPTLVTAGSYHYYSAIPWNGYPSFTEQGVNPSGFTWLFPLTSTNAGWECFGCNQQTSYVKAGGLSTYVSVRAHNTCGYTTKNYEVFVQQQGCPPGGCVEPFIVYPNPSSEELTVSTNLTDKETTSEITLVDSQGTVVYSSKVKSSEQVKIPVREFKNGLYYLKVSQNGVTEQRQIIINH